MPMQAWFPDETRSVQPGDNLRLVLTVENPTPHSDTFTITAAGMNVSWVTVSEPSINLAGGGLRVVDVWVHPPRLSTTAAGRNEVAVRIVAESDPAVALTCDAVVVVEPFDDRSVSVLQPVVRARRRALFEILVRNDGNEMAHCRMRLVDTSQRIEGMFDPPTVGVSPGEAGIVQLRARIGGAWFRRSDRLVPFQIDASETDHVTATASATVLQSATLGGSWAGRIATAIGAVALLALGWVFFLRGWIDDRIEGAVNDRVAAVQVDQQGEVTAVVPTATQPPAPAVSGDVGEPVAIRLVPEAAVGATGVDSYLVEGGLTLYLSDLLLQNPARDGARATLSIGDDTLYEWNLSEMNGANEFQPRVTPIPVPAGSELKFSLTCEAVGEADQPGCTAALLLTGRLGRSE